MGALYTTTYKLCMKRMFMFLRYLILCGGFITPIFCYNMIPGISILHDPLSRFGVEPNTKVIWLIFIFIMGIALLVFGKNANNNIMNKTHRYILNLVLYTSIGSFIMSGVIDMNVRLTHLVLAGLFFLLYVIYIFIFGIYATQYRILRYAICITIINLLFLIPTFTMGISYGLFEVVFVGSVLFWNFILNLFVSK